MLRDGTEKALTANVMTEEYGKARASLAGIPNNSEMAISCDLAPNRIFEKSESWGRDLEREIASSLL